ncbi:hypothetical protein [Microbacterium sp.]|uniref:hypothetical protein n=1 Tax=Microbacterium sp. TaxID=51671 RepID=UPI003A83890A
MGKLVDRSDAHPEQHADDHRRQRDGPQPGADGILRPREPMAPRPRPALVVVSTGSCRQTLAAGLSRWPGREA